MARYALNRTKWTLAALLATMVTATAVVGCGGENGETPVGDAGNGDAGNGDASSQTIAPPQFDPPAGTFSTAQSVSIRTDTPGAVVHYTLDGNAPNATSPIYGSPISIAKTATLKAIAVKEGWNDSEVQSGNYVIDVPRGTVAQVQIKPNAGRYWNDVDVTLSSDTTGATICYSLDGSVPTCAANGQCAPGNLTYTSPLSMPKVGAKVQANACKAGMLPAESTSAEYTFSASLPQVDPPPEQYDPLNPVRVKISTSTEGGVIHYTVNGRTPTCDSPDTFVTTGTFPQFKGFTHVQALTCKDGYATSSVWDGYYESSTCDGTFYVGVPGELDRISHCREITGSLIIEHNPDITDLTPLQHLERVGYELRVTVNRNLKSLHGLEALSSVGGDMWISGVYSSVRLDALSALETVGGRLVLLTSGVTDWSGPPRLKFVGGLAILGEAQLKRIGFPVLTTIKGDLAVENNGELSTFDDIPNLTTVTGKVYFGFNPKLETVSGLRFLQQTAGLDIRSNEQLTKWAALPNAVLIDGDLVVKGNPRLSQLELPNLHYVNGRVFLEDLPALTTLQGLGNLSSIASLTVDGVQGFTNFRGLENLRTVTNDISFWKLSGPVDLTGLAGVSSAESLYVTKSVSLKSLQGLDWIPKMKSISIENNQELTELGALRGVEEAGSVSITKNPKLEKLNGLTALKKLQDKLEVSDNAALPACHAEGLAKKLRDLGNTCEMVLRSNNGTGTCNAGP